ncbi:MAG: TonB-dependent receptor [Candidatus Solibacter usitatus]|nr:TonB-dependent receptor [Candidatus Solibacter usitatus]
MRLAAILLFTSCLGAQTVTGTLDGHIKDSTGGLIANAKVTARNNDNGLTRTAATGSTGYFQMTFLPVGDYSVTAESSGFTTVRRAAVVELNATRSVDFELKPAGVATEVTVTEEIPLIEVSRGDVKNNIEQQVIEDRPLSSRNILSLVEMLPGFQSSGSYSGINNPTLSSGSYVSFSGTGSRSATFQIDGVNNDDSSEGSSRQNVNVSAIKEFQVLTNSYAAEFGRAGGAVVLVQTKSGTNRFHGDAYEFLQNEKLNANSFYGNASGRRPDGTEISPRAPYRRNQFGYTAGGPIRKNKLFFFHSLEQTRLIQYNTFTRWIFLPTDKLQVGDCRLCLNPAEHPNVESDRRFLQSILDRFPREAPNNPNLCDHCFTATRHANYPDQDYSGKLDWNPGQRDAFVVRYQYSRQKRFPLPLIQGETAYQNNRQQNVGATHTHMFSASTWGEFRFGLGLRTTLVDISSGNDTPIVRISNASAYTTTTMGSAGQFPINRYQTDYQFVYNLSHIRGRHIVRAGIDFRRQHLNDLADNYSRGWWTFGQVGVRGQPTFYEGWENFLRGYYTTFEKGYGNFTTFNRLGEFNQYVMDDIRITPTLTLNVGFRWEVVLKPSEAKGKVQYLFDTFKDGYEPRFGFAWSPGAHRSSRWGKITGGPGRLSVRGGYGIFHNRIFQSVFSQGGASLRSQPPYGIYSGFGAGFETADPTKGFLYTPGYDPGRISVGQVDPGLRMPSIQQLHFTIDRQLPGRIALSIGYNRTRGIGLLANQNTNRARFPFLSPVDGILYDKIETDLGTTAPRPGYISIAQPRYNQRRPDTRYGTVVYIHNGSWSYYNALRLSINKRYSAGLHWAVAYTLGKTVDTGSDVTAGVTISEFGAAINNRGLSDFDQRQRLNLNYGYQLPFFKTQRGVRAAALKGWTLTGNMTLASANPFTVSSGIDFNSDGVVNDRPLILKPQYFGATVDDGRRNANGVIVSTTQLPLDAFYPNLGTPLAQRPFDPGGSGKGSIGRNTFYGQNLFNLDFGLYKSFRIREGHNVMFRTEMYGATNTPHFGFPTRSTNSASFGVIAGTFNPFNYVGASRSDASARVVQFALRYTF